MRSKFLALAVAPILGASAASAGLVVHYTFDGDDATNSGTGPAGTAVGGSSYVDSTAAPGAGRAWQGNRTGANDAYIQTGLTGTDLGFGAGGTYTAMAWVNWGGVSGSNDHMVFGQEDGAGNNAQLHHGIRSEGPDANADNIHFGGWGGTQDISDAGTVAPSTWTHVTWQYDGTEAVVYVNGVETARAVKNNITDPALAVIIGGHGRDAADPAGQSFNGLLDDVRIYDEALTLGEINSARTAIPEPSSLGLLALTGLAFLRRRR